MVFKKGQGLLQLGEKNPFYGKHHTKKSKQKMSLSHKGKGHCHTEESKQKIREKALEQFKNGMPEETKRKIGLAGKGKITWMKGKHHTEESRKKMSIGAKKSRGMKGKHHSEKSKQKISSSNIGKQGYWEGKHFTEEHRKNLGLAHKGRVVWNKDKKNCFNEKTLEKMRLSHTGRIVTEETRRKISELNKGKIISEETRKKLRDVNIDWDFYNEHGCLKSNYPYSDCFTDKFKDMIRARDGNKCVVTGMTNEEHNARYDQSLHVHHWTYDKDVTDPFYFVTVTCGINAMARRKRGEWINMFNGIMEDKYCEMLKTVGQTTIEHWT